MKNIFTVLFFFDGATRNISVELEKPPLNKSEAEAAAWGAIRTWFELKHIEIPDFVTNVRHEDIEDYSWDIMPMPSSIELCK